MARKGQAAGRAVHAEDGDRVGSLVAAVEEAAGRIEGEAARIVAACPFLADVRQSGRRTPTEKMRCCRAGGCRRTRSGRRRRPGSPSRSCCRRNRAAASKSSAAASSRPDERRSRRARSWSLPPGSNRASAHSGGSRNDAVRLPAQTQTEGGIVRRQHAALDRRSFQMKILSKPKVGVQHETA